MPLHHPHLIPSLPRRGPHSHTSSHTSNPTCSAMQIMGSENTSVLPDPVNAMPIMSRPLSATGRPCIWMGVGLLIFFSASTRLHAHVGLTGRLSRFDLPSQYMDGHGLLAILIISLIKKLAQSSAAVLCMQLYNVEKRGETCHSPTCPTCPSA